MGNRVVRLALAGVFLAVVVVAGACNRSRAAPGEGSADPAAEDVGSAPTVRPHEAPPAPAAPILHRPLEIARLTYKAGRVRRGDWVASTTVFPTRSLRVLVVASWCHFSEELVNAMWSDPGLRRKVDVIMVFEDEVPLALSRAVSHHQIDKAQASQLRKQLAANHQIVIAPRFFRPVDISGPQVPAAGMPTPALPTLGPSMPPFYMVRRGTLDALITGYPSAVVCDEGGCIRTERPDAT